MKKIDNNGGVNMSRSSEAKDYKLLSFKTNARIPEEYTEEKAEIIKFNDNTKVLKKYALKYLKDNINKINKIFRIFFITSSVSTKII